MLNKKQIEELIEKTGLNPVAKKFVEMVLRNFEDEDIISEEKMEAITKVIEAEDRVRQDMADRSSKKTKDFQVGVSSLQAPRVKFSS